MNYRRFGKTGLQISETGFGAWAIGGAAKVGDLPIGWGTSDDRVSLEALQTAFEQGINFYDTADFYSLGHSEELIGKAFGNSDKVIIASKVGQKPGKTKPVDIDYSKSYVLQACEASLKRLQRDQVDYYQLHVAQLQHLQQGDCIDAMQTLKEQGKIRYWGISLSTYNPFPEAEYMMLHQLGDGFQLVFNVINQVALPLLAKMQEKEYGIIARMPLQFGLLTGKFNPSTRFDETDHRSFRLNPEIIQSTNILVDKLQPLADKYGMTKTAFAFSFIFSFPEITTIIPGIRTPEQAITNSHPVPVLSREDKQKVVDMFDADFAPLLKQMQLLG